MKGHQVSPRFWVCQISLNDLFRTDIIFLAEAGRDVGHSPIGSNGKAGVCCSRRAGAGQGGGHNKVPVR